MIRESITNELDGLWVSIYAESPKKGRFSSPTTVVDIGEVKGKQFFGKNRKQITGQNFFLIAKVKQSKDACSIIPEIKDNMDGMWVAIFTESGNGSFSSPKMILDYGEVRGKWFYGEISEKKKLITGSNIVLIKKF